jgi:predicted amidophosphoribosyltransferase
MHITNIPYRLRYYWRRTLVSLGVCPDCWNLLNKTRRAAFCPECGCRK